MLCLNHSGIFLNIFLANVLCWHFKGLSKGQLLIFFVTCNIPSSVARVQRSWHFVLLPLVPRRAACFGEAAPAADFGVSRILTAGSKAETMVGTYYWMPPEILANGRAQATFFLSPPAVVFNWVWDCRCQTAHQPAPVAAPADTPATPAVPPPFLYAASCRQHHRVLFTHSICLVSNQFSPFRCQCCTALPWSGVTDLSPQHLAACCAGRLCGPRPGPVSDATPYSVEADIWSLGMVMVELTPGATAGVGTTPPPPAARPGHTYPSHAEWSEKGTLTSFDF